MKRVLVTGATGFIGRHVLAPLQDLGFEVHAVARSGARPAAGEKIVWHELDLLESLAADRFVSELGATHLMHFAWFAKHGEYWTAAENLDWVAASLRLVRAFQRAGGKRVVVAGTCAEYDWSDASLPCNEDATRLAPHTLYGTAKNALRTILQSYSATCQLQWAWGRVFLLYGPGEAPERFVPSLVRSLAQGGRAVCRSSNLVRDLMHVSDVGRAFAILLDSEVTGPVNIATGAPVSLGAIAREIARQLSAEDRLELQDQTCSATVPVSLVADTRRLNSEVGFRPQVDLREGVRRILEM